MTDNLVHRLIYLVSVLGAGKEKIWKLYSRFGSFEAIETALRSGLNDGTFTPAETTSASRTTDSQIKSVTDYCNKNSIGIICWGDDDYPVRLRNIPNPPVMLFYRGDKEILNGSYVIAMVGSRKISDYGLKVTEHIAGSLAENGVTVASGFAEGTDIAAHLAAVRNGGKTIAVLGCGIDYNYPANNIQYSEELLRSGVFVSEYLPKSSAKPVNFVERNRILTGLSLGTAVMEAGEKSGSLNSAGHTLLQGRDLWVVPVHDITDSRYYGNRQLLKDGASAIYSADDILGAYFENIPYKQSNSVSDVTVPKKEKLKASPKKKTPAVQADSAEKRSAPQLNDDEKIVYDILRTAEASLSADEIAVRADMDIFVLLSLLTNLEIAGIITSDDGVSYRLK